MKPAFPFLFLIGVVIAMPASVVAQRDNVFLDRGETQRGSSRLTGQVTGSTRDSVEVVDGGETISVPAHTVKKIVFGEEPSALDRARDRFADRRFADCLEELRKIDSDPASSMIQQEIDFLAAAANAEIALSGGEVTPQVAGQQLSKFVRDYPQAYQYYPAVDLMGQLLMGIGRVDLAAAEFAKLADAQGPLLRLQGLFRAGSAQLIEGQREAARTAFETVVKATENSPEIRQWKVASECQLARIQALEGDVEAARERLENVVKTESEDNAFALAYAYLGLGTCHQQAGDLKAAALAYLHNDLLFVAQHEPRAESLYQLVQIWPQLNNLDAANRARSTLLSRYRNSVWANRL